MQTHRREVPVKDEAAVATAAGAVAAAPPRRMPLPAFHLGLAVLMTIVAVLGFRPFYLRMITGEASAHPLIYLHAAVFNGWLVLLLAQTWLVHGRRVGTHMRVGRFGVAFGVLVLLTGIISAFLLPALNVTTGAMSLDEAAGFLVLPIGDMVLFTAFFVPAILARRDRERHRRYMVLAAVALIFPGAARFALPAGPAAILLVWLAPLLAAMAHDLWVNRRVHRVYWVGLAVFLVGFARVALMEAEVWLRIGRPIITATLPWVP
jgi:hypothetical protein